MQAKAQPSAPTCSSSHMASRQLRGAAAFLAGLLPLPAAPTSPPAALLLWFSCGAVERWGAAGSAEASHKQPWAAARQEQKHHTTKHARSMRRNMHPSVRPSVLALSSSACSRPQGNSSASSSEGWHCTAVTRASQAAASSCGVAAMALRAAEATPASGLSWGSSTAKTAPGAAAAAAASRQCMLRITSARSLDPKKG